ARHGYGVLGHRRRCCFRPGVVVGRAQLPSHWFGIIAAVCREDSAGGRLAPGPSRSVPDLHRARCCVVAGVVPVHEKSRGVAGILRKHWMAFGGFMLLAVAYVVTSERRKVDVPESAAALLYLVADSEQELTRIPVSFTRMSDEEEIRIGDQLARFYSSSAK